jgi:tetratricopeptide (TPR) repeat protein
VRRGSRLVGRALATVPGPDSSAFKLGTGRIAEVANRQSEKFSLSFVSMKMRYRVLSLLLVLTLAFCHTAAGLSLRDQLALAEKDGDTYAQIELIRRILDKESRDDALRERLANLWLSVEDFGMAASTVQDWKAAPEALRVRVVATVLFVRDGKKAEAVNMLEAFVTRHPEDIEMTRQLAGYLDGIGEPRKVVDLLSRTPGVENDAGLLVSRALARRKVRDFAGALQDFEVANRADPESETVANNRPAFDRLRTALAGINAANAVLMEKPADAAALVSRAYWYLSTGFANGPAFEDAEAARRIDPKSIAALILFVEASNRTGRLSAEEALEKLAVDVSKPVPILIVLDRLWRHDAQISRDPRDVSALVGRSRELSEEAQQFQLALRDAEAALAVDPKSAPGQVAKIFALAKLGKIEEAAGELRALEPMKPTRELLAQALRSLVDAAMSASQLDLALEFSDRAIKARPEAQSYKQRAAILQRLERFAEAQDDLARAQQLEKAAP